MKTKQGHFEVRRDKGDVCIRLFHVATGQPAGGFSHLAVRTLRAAKAGMDAVEEAMGERDLALLSTPDSGRRRNALENLKFFLLREFPNGAWSRGV